MTKYFVEHYGESQEVQEVFESYNGWYWFVTDRHADKEDPNIRFGLVYGQEVEWGYWSMEELDPLIRRGKVWVVPKSNWFSISHIIKGYEDRDQQEEVEPVQ